MRASSLRLRRREEEEQQLWKLWRPSTEKKKS